jgi:hypothetical protein
VNQRSALIIAAALTAFLIVLVVGLASRLSNPATLETAAKVAPQTEEVPASIVVPLDPAVEAMVRDREAAYQQALAEANNRLSMANDQIAQANSEISTLEQSRQQIADQFNQSPVIMLAPVTAAPAEAAPAEAAPASAAPVEPANFVPDHW